MAKTFFYVDNADNVIRQVRVTKLLLHVSLDEIGRRRWVYDQFVGYSTNNRTERSLVSEFGRIDLQKSVEDFAKSISHTRILDAHCKQVWHGTIADLFDCKCLTYAPTSYVTSSTGIQVLMKIEKGKYIPNAYAWVWNGVKAVFVKIADDEWCFDAVTNTLIFDDDKYASRYYSTQEDCEKVNEIKVEMFEDDEEDKDGLLHYQVKDLPRILDMMKDYFEGQLMDEDEYCVNYFEQIIKSGLFHDAIGKIVDIEGDEIKVTTEY